jgi:glucan phosphoethanolaminetransferase (alkaline phosphatase superfamily)
MISKIYLIALVLSSATAGFSAYYAKSWLGSIGNPANARDGFLFQSSFGWTFLWISFLLLTLISILMIWQKKAKWAVWVTMAYFLASATILLFNDMSFKSFLDSNSLESSTTLLNPFYVGIMLVVVFIALASTQVITANFRVKVKGNDKPKETSESEE